MSDDYLWDRRGDDPEVARLERLLGGLAHDAPLAPLPTRGPRRALWIGGAVAVVAAAAVLAIAIGTDRTARRSPCATGRGGFTFSIQGGAARCDGVATQGGQLPVGTWLETPAGATAEVAIADIGALTLAGDSRLQLAATGADQHRLALARGSLRARVTAPPRLFVIDTPTATAVDLGCAYELEVLADGRTRLAVTSGVVELGAAGRLAFVTVGATVTTVPGRGPGTPVATAAAPAFVALIDRLDRGDASALPAALAAAGPGDTLTLWNLLANGDAAARSAILARLDELFPRPEWILERDVIAGQPDAMNALRDVLTSDVWLAPPRDPDPAGGVWK